MRTAKQKTGGAKQTGAVALFILTSFAFAGSALAADLPAALVDPYLRVHAALASDKTDTVKADAGQIARAAGSLGAQAKPVADAARQLEVAPNVQKARDAFGTLSDAMLAYIKATGSTPASDVKVGFCPMAGKPWLQKGTSVRNPYYGLGMLECGEIREIKE